MKKLLLFLFCLSIFIFNIDVNGDDNYSVISNPESEGFYVINNEFSYEELKSVFEKSDLFLLAIKPSNFDEYIKLEGNDITSLLNSGNNKIINKLGLDENTIKYKVGNYSISSIKIYGKNKDVANLLKVIHSE